MQTHVLARCFKYFKLHVHSEVVVDRNSTMSSPITRGSGEDETMAKHGSNGENDPREDEVDGETMAEPVTLECLEEPSGAGICAGDSNSVRPGTDQVNRKKPLAAMPGQLPGPEQRRITRSQGALSTDSPQVIKPVKANPTIKDLMELISSNHVQTTQTLADITERMTDFEQSRNFNYAKITDNEKAIDEIRKENCDLRDVIDGLVVELKQTRIDLEQVRKRQDDSERRSREWGIRIHGVPEKPKEDTRVVLYDILSKNKLAGVTSPDMASKIIEHCHRIGPYSKEKTRAIIANLYSRPVRNQLLKDARGVNNGDTGMFIAADMIKTDHILKMKARAQMKRAHDEGHKVSFRKGKLIINSRVVPIEGAGGEQATTELKTWLVWYPGGLMVIMEFSFHASVCPTNFISAWL